LRQEQADRQTALQQNVILQRQDALAQHQEHIQIRLKRLAVLEDSAEQLGNLDLANKYAGEKSKLLVMEQRNFEVEKEIRQQDLTIRAHAIDALGRMGKDGGATYFTEADYTKFWSSTLDQFKGKNGKIEGQNRKSALWALGQARSETQTLDTWSDRLAAAGEHFGLSKEEVQTLLLRLAPSIFPEEFLRRVKPPEDEPPPPDSAAAPHIPWRSEVELPVISPSDAMRPILDTIPHGNFAPAAPSSTRR
jgi:hypothetical protein